MKEITFLVHEAEEGGYHAEALGLGIFAEGDTIDALKENIRSGIDCFYDDKTDWPSLVHLHYIKDEIMAL